MCDGVYLPRIGSAGVNHALWAEEVMPPHLCSACFSWTQDTKESRSAQAGMAAEGSRGALQAPAERLPVLQDSEASRTVAAADPQPPNARDGGETPESLRLPAAEERVGSSLGGRSIDPVEVAGLTQHALEGSPLSWWQIPLRPGLGPCGIGRTQWRRAHH